MNNLKKIRAKYGLTQQELANRVGVSRQTINYAENKCIPLDLAYKCADIFNENVFNIIGSDILKLMPRTHEECEIVINSVNSIIKEYLKDEF